MPSLTDLGEPLHEGTHTTDECKYLSASPWVANVTGRNFTPDGGRSAYFSQVVIEPTDADIAAIRATASDDGFQQRCILPSEHSAVQDSLTEANAQTPVGSHLPRRP